MKIVVWVDEKKNRLTKPIEQSFFESLPWEKKQERNRIDLLHEKTLGSDYAKIAKVGVVSIELFFTIEKFSKDENFLVVNSPDFECAFLLIRI